LIIKHAYAKKQVQAVLCVSNLEDTKRKDYEFSLARGKKKTVRCPVEGTLAVIGGKWKVLVLYYLLDGTKRFNELHRALEGISHRTLVKQLRELEKDGIVKRKIYPQIPPKVEYSLTPRGKDLQPVLFAMHAWNQKHG